jgi:glycosyltransferase involved in cell wall biosynthesis
MTLRILYFGIYSRGIEYPRNNNLIHGLRLNGIDVIEAHFELAGSFQKRLKAVQNPLKAFHFFLSLIASFLTLTWKFIHSPQVDIIIVGHPGYFHIHLARILRLLFRKQAVLVYDIFIPLYEALVEDRKLIKQSSLLGRLLYRFEKSCCRCADLCLIDTREHCRYISRQYDLPPDKISRLFVGATIDQPIESPQIAVHENLRVLFVGTYIPLHGIDVILNAARHLKNDSDIIFTLVGSGQLRKKMENMAHQWKLTNIIFKDWIATEQLGAFIQSFDLSLGIFGMTPKTSRVIPSKIFDICASGVPFITADSPAIREVFSHGKNAYLVSPGNPKELADAICALKTNPELGKILGKGAKQIGKYVFSLKKLGDDFLNAVEKKNLRPNIHRRNKI